MTDLEIRFHPEAADEAETAYSWYKIRSNVAAKSFVSELEFVIQRISQYPQSGTSLGNSRRYLFPRFPFSLVYRLKNSSLEVIAVAHNKRKPGYWKNR